MFKFPYIRFYCFVYLLGFGPSPSLLAYSYSFFPDASTNIKLKGVCSFSVTFSDNSRSPILFVNPRGSFQNQGVPVSGQSYDLNPYDLTQSVIFPSSGSTDFSYSSTQTVIARVVLSNPAQTVDIPFVCSNGDTHTMTAGGSFSGFTGLHDFGSFTYDVDSGATTYYPTDVPPVAVDDGQDLTLMGPDLPNPHSIDGDTTGLDFVKANPDGTFDNFSIYDTVPLAGSYSADGSPTISLESLGLSDGDTLAIGDRNNNMTLGTVHLTPEDNLIWVPEGTDYVSSTSSSVSGVDTVTTSTTSPNGSVTVTSTTIDITNVSNESTNFTSNNTSSSSVVNNTEIGDGTEDTTFTLAEEQAGALNAAAAGELAGNLEGAALYDDPNANLLDNFDDAASKLSASTDSLRAKLDDYRPWGVTSVPTTSTYDLTMPLGPHVASFTINTQLAGFRIVYAVELMLVSIAGIRLFFNILKV